MCAIGCANLGTARRLAKTANMKVDAVWIRTSMFVHSQHADAIIVASNDVAACATAQVPLRVRVPFVVGRTYAL